MVIEQILQDFEILQNEVEDYTNYCTSLFQKLVDKNSIPEDVYYSARAFTSIINTIVNKKVEYISYVINNQIETLGFLKTFDDKYLSNIENLLSEQCSSEIIFIQELADDNLDLISFLEDFLKNLPLKKNNLPLHLQKELNNILEQCEKKYKEE